MVDDILIFSLEMEIQLKKYRKDEAVLIVLQRVKYFGWTTFRVLYTGITPNR